jgi:hypothetical protein
LKSWKLVIPLLGRFQADSGLALILVPQVDY